MTTYQSKDKTISKLMREVSPGLLNISISRDNIAIVDDSLEPEKAAKKDKS